MSVGCLHQADKDEGRSGSSKRGDLDFNSQSHLVHGKFRPSLPVLTSRVLGILPPLSALRGGQGCLQRSGRGNRSKDTRLPLHKKVKLLLWLKELNLSCWHWRAGLSALMARAHILTSPPRHRHPFSLLVIKACEKKTVRETRKTVEHKRDFLPSNKLQEESCMHKIPLYYHFHGLLWEDSAFFSYRPMISKASGLLTPPFEV